MADLGEKFDPNGIPEREGGFDPIPPGWYEVQVMESETVDLKSGNGRALVLTFNVLGPAFANRKLWDRLNIQHKSQEAQAIAQRALADLFLATGTAASRNSEDLHFKPLLARVAIDPAKDGYDAKNVIKAYKARTGAVPATRPAAAAQRTAVAQRAPERREAAKGQTGATGGRPWARAAPAAHVIDDDIPF